jgi:probable DNA metabolism protein
MEERYIYLCEDSFEGIMSGVWRAYEDRHGHEKNEIRIREPGFNQELFCRYIPVETDFDHAVKVARTVQRDISRQAYEFIQKAAISCFPEKADAVYRFIIYGLHVGKQILDCLTLPFMQTLYEIERNVNNEIYHWKEFLRFQELANGTLFGKINPKGAVLPYLADHFADRYSGEDWLIADTVHQTVLIHRGERGCLYASMEEVDFDELTLQYSAEEKDMQQLWKLFVDTIAIKERRNTDLQRQMLPLWFRKYMKEYQDE